jgi:FAD/FMN-containing dehydrogenase/Fe-S oxidoreductase
MADQRRIHDDLKGVLRGEVLCDDLTRMLYSTDASIFEVRPLGVVVPRDEEDLSALVRYAAEHEVPLVPRGAGTGLAGESLGSGLVIDLSRHLKRVLEVGADTIRVQPGVTLRELSGVLATIGRRFAPDPANPECTVGGMVSTNASGARACLHGYTRDHVESLRVVLDTGEAVTVSRHPRQVPPPTSTIVAHASARLHDIVTSLATLFEENAELVRKQRPRTRFDRCGYQLQDVVDDDRRVATHARPLVEDSSRQAGGLQRVATHARPLVEDSSRQAGGDLHLARLLTGSEGTLGLVTEATLRTLPLPGGQALVLCTFDRLETALQAAQISSETSPSACDLLDRRLLALARGAPFTLPSATEAVLLVEYEGDSPGLVRDQAQELAERLQWRDRLAVRALVAVEPEERDRLWGLRDAALTGLQELRSGSRAVPLIEDVAVPPGALSDYLDGVQKLLHQHEATAAFLIHAAAGQVHTRPLLDLRRPEGVARLLALAEDVHTLALALGGTVSSQNGTGLARTPWVARQFGPLYPVLQQVKAIFDPRHLFNPGKIIAQKGIAEGWSLRTGFGSRDGPAGGPEVAGEPAILPHPALGLTASGMPTSLRWLETDPRAESQLCNGCGQCRTAAPGSRMCPVFRATGTEAATPRAKANLLRHLLEDSTDLRALSSNEVRAVADLCVNCKMCAQECPSRVDIPRLMLEAKAANVGRHGLDRTDWVLARAETFAWAGSALAPVTNALLGNRAFRWVLEKLFGVSRRRRLPRFASRSFLRQARRRGWARPPGGPGQRVAYFVDVFANYSDPLIAEAAVAVLHHNGIEVYVPPGQRGSGMAPLACGDVETARRILLRNLRPLGELARAGYTIVCTEPTAALMLTQDALDLLADPDDLADATLVARQTVEWTTFIWELLQQGRLRTDFSPLEVSVGHHVPCHLKALGEPPRGPGLLALIPGMRVRTIDVSCSGMAGTFGLKAANYGTSLEAGRPMLEEMGRPGILFGSTECSTCRMQMEDGAGKRTLHPAQYLALAYGLLPELADRLQQPIRERVL